MAERAGISPRFVSAIENDRRKPSLDVLIRLVHAIGTSFDEVLMPQTISEEYTADRIKRLITQCSQRDQELVLALIDQMLDSKEEKQ
ncbi:XRE family transcriptional regulator [Blautia pseudococcoides]|uniref:XRE family transcriptional regulator n=1 Tax=Blautia pseudococcoides TaxID=1796616 RepID=A0A1V0QER7_9FIRM|nr:helix-turn-helix transcriptional regulator [Blautia pseudococcoides]ARE64936.1 XRE family transcriptional regulator [Blautia pseudococcoides]ASU30403.1 XRE family transcriptional regulator [Blautia pseudococcoides]QQQ95513.1 helix-turn-helix transcriptional regulator [Blautia pseudococcoides]